LFVRRFALLASLVVVVAACSSGASKASETSSTSSAHQHSAKSAAPSQLRVRADGTLEPEQIDLSGVDGVTADERARAEDLLRNTIVTLPQWADVEKAKADGFESIGDAPTGEEHYLHWDWIDDDVMTDPAHPEALVYKVGPDGSRTLEAAMYMMPKKYTLDNAPDIGGSLIQYHVHDDLCFTPPPAPKVRGLTTVGGECHAPLVKFNPNVMIHVWIRPNACGPFAALQGIGAGQIKAGETRACEHKLGALTL
jgi:hypothetical protein